MLPNAACRWHQEAEGTRTLVAFGLPVALVLAAGVVWPAVGEPVTLLLRIAVLYVFSTR